MLSCVYPAEFDLLHDSRYKLEIQRGRQSVKFRRHSSSLSVPTRKSKEFKSRCAVFRLILIFRSHIQEALHTHVLIEPILAYQLQKLQHTVSAHNSVHQQRLSLIGVGWIQRHHTTPWHSTRSYRLGRSHRRCTGSERCDVDSFRS